MLSTLTWVSDSNYDVFQDIFDVPDYLIETPLAYDGLLIDEYIRTPMYKGLFKNEITYSGDSTSFNQLLDNIDLKVLSYTIPVIEVELLPGVMRLLQISLYKRGYDTKMIFNKEDVITLIPMINDENMYTDEFVDIDVEAFIGYKPLIDLYTDQVDTKIAASDLIDLCDLSFFNYKIIDGIKVVEVNGQSEKEVISVRAEFTIERLLPIVSKIVNLYPTTFYVKPSVLANEVIDVYQFKRMGDFIQHPSLTKSWFLESMKRIEDGLLPLMTMNGEWIFQYESNLETLAYLKYAAIRAYVDLYKNSPVLNHYKDIKVSSDLNVSVPIFYDDVEKIKNKINQYMNKKTDQYVQVFGKDDAIYNRVRMSLDNNGIYLTFPLNKTWVVVGNKVPQQTYKGKTSESDGVFDVVYEGKDVVGLMEKPLKVKNDWSSLYQLQLRPQA